MKAFDRTKTHTHSHTHTHTYKIPKYNYLKPNK